MKINSIMKSRIILTGILILIFLSSFVYANDKVIEFDENEEIIVTTITYNSSGMRCLDCSCNFTLFNPYPNETFINFTNLMLHKGNGVFSLNVSNYTNLTENKNIYPMVIDCNDSSGIYGGDNREGLKVNPTAFDYTAIILATLGVGVVLLLSSFFVDKKFSGIKKLTFFSSFAFFFLTIANAYVIADISPKSGNLNVLSIASLSAILMVILAVMFLYYKERLVTTAEILSKTRR